MFLQKLSVLMESSMWEAHLLGTRINVTMIVAVNVTGTHVPPMLMFLSVHFKNHMLTGAPTASTGGQTQQVGQTKGSSLTIYSTSSSS
jgi:hypothetical protein